MALATPVDRQREVVYLGGVGHNVVLGTAGSGKTSMAILRAAYLSDPRRPDHGRTLLITFNKTLGTYIRHIAKDVLDRVKVENFHLFARGYLASRGLLPDGWLLQPHRRQTFVLAAMAQVKALGSGDALLSRPVGFFEDEIEWIARHGISTLAEYDATPRTGRAEARMLKSQRPVMWQVYEAYLALRAAQGFQYDLDDIAGAVAAAFDVDTNTRLYKHVIVDEGQDLSPIMLRALAKAVPAGGSLTFFGDIAQQIYGHRMSWRSAGLRPAKIWNFEENYRNTKEIADLALAISRMPYYAEAADLVSPRQPTAAGPKPTLICFQDEDAETDFVVRRAAALGQGRSVAVLARTKELATRIASRLPGPVQRLTRDLGAWSSNPGVSTGTLHSGKGLEFDAVIMPFLSDARFPNPIAVEADGLEEASAGDGRLLYVGVTRARSELILTHTGEPTRLLPPEPSLYTKVTR
ncbi:UvrD-helicase domain-containing protein [Sphingomonas sp. JC676]|uniref:3'-5' exonuclease n=1 Tax=Sphingomonas sp. JC676 TaxID=2768065 RepID=UPI001657B9AD|nr:3'-5' exonuclease [Sphingomonas sp. JC676]MBC9030783.1 UvrD-helicase domain-containing protein [Sphingomonas sp. JC676]